MGTTYYTRAYATNSAGTAYGNELTFRTLTYPTVITTVASNISVTTASSGGNITDDGGAAITARGVCWSTSINPTVADSYTSDGTGIGNFNSSITGLVAGTTYYLRAYATNSVGTAYGSTVSFTTLDQPTVITNIVTNITSTTAVSGGDVTNEGGTPVTVRGIVWNTVGSPDINSYIGITSNGGGMGTFTATMTSLTPGQTYYVRAYATNIINTSYGQEETFSANPIPPIVNTNSVSNITNNTATVDGTVVDSGGATVTVRGFCYNTSGNPTIADNVVQNGSGIGNYSSNLSGLTPGQTYYICAYATNSAGTAYGSTISFTTLSAPCGGIATITDYDGNVYNTLEIGLQCWMKENLRTTHYSNGTLIDLGSGTSSTNKYRYYPGNNSSNVATYGYLYNWTAAMNGAASTNSNPSGVQGVCPTGWHVPSDAEWTQLINYVSSQSQYMCGGTSTYIAKALANTTGWNTASGTCVIGNNLSGNNATGFGAMPAGMYYGSYAYFGTEAYYLCATAVYLRKLYSGDANVNKINRYKEEAYSVRCVRN